MINIVSNSLILRKFSLIDIFKLDLGKNLLGGEHESIKIHDEFINLYQKNGRIIHKFGSIGSLKFYLDPTLDNDIFIIYKESLTYEIDFQENDNIKTYLSEILMKIDEHQKEQEEEIKKIESQPKTTGLWIAQDEKNRGRAYEINQTLDKEEYLLEAIKKQNQT